MTVVLLDGMAAMRDTIMTLWRRIMPQDRFQREYICEKNHWVAIVNVDGVLKECPKYVSGVHCGAPMRQIAGRRMNEEETANAQTQTKIETPKVEALVARPVVMAPCD